MIFRGFRVPYYWSIYQSEWATDVMFRRASDLAVIYPALVLHGMQTFSSGDVMRFLGRKVHGNFEGEIISDLYLDSTGRNPLTIFDSREGQFRNVFSGGLLPRIGIMGIVELNVNNLRRLFAGSIGASGTQALNNNGFIFYFSDRRGNRDGSGNETGEFGFEDVVSSSNSTLDTGEDFNGNGMLETYGGNLPSGPFTPYPANTGLLGSITGGREESCPLLSACIKTGRWSCSKSARAGIYSCRGESGVCQRGLQCER